MKTQQAHSPIVEDRVAVRRRPRLGPVLWLNLVCLDAPLVAVAWLWLFARTFRIPLQVGNGLALFLTAWLIYLGDRWADCASLKPAFPRSLRQEFCLRHREIWVATILLVAGFDAYVIWRTTALETFLVGAVVGVLAFIYLVVNHRLGLIWRSLPAKEFVIGILFTAGTLVALMPASPSLSAAFAASALAFAALCALNCISIAGWERDLDRAQEKVSIATRHPGIVRRVAVTSAGLALAAFAMAIVHRPIALLAASIGLSALLVTWLNFLLPRVSTDERTALADLVLLTPVVALIASAP